MYVTETGKGLCVVADFSSSLDLSIVLESQHGHSSSRMSRAVLFLLLQWHHIDRINECLLRRMERRKQVFVT